MSGPRRPVGGVVFPSPLVMLSIVAVAMAAIALVATRGGGPQEREVATPVRDQPSATASVKPGPTSDPAPKTKPKPKPVDRGAVSVEVYNNSGVAGLAGRVSATTTEAGWKVIGTDNWYGSIPTNTVYFPPSLKAAAKQLALDLGVRRTAPADGEMKLDRLTVILTGEIG